ncbi:MAG: selenoneine biosynthesis selenosugar synthase SenB [Vulcanimicrobiaceae bacterium]
MRILILSPAPAHSTLGNAVTAERYARILRSLGHRVRIARTYTGVEPADCLIALHARRSGSDALRFRRANARGALMVVLTGTDVYRDIRTSRTAQRALDAADAIVTLQPRAIDELPERLRAKARAILQSAPARPRPKGRTGGRFEFCVLGHLRHEKDPMRAAYAVRRLPLLPPVRVTQAGGVLDARYLEMARREAGRNPRYRYLGELARGAARRLLVRSDALVLSSRMEGGANVLGEAIAAGTPVLASRIPGNVGILGSGYPGLYALGDTGDLARLMRAASTDRAFYDSLRRACAALAPLMRESAERAAWKRLLRDVT